VAGGVVQTHARERQAKQRPARRTRYTPGKHATTATCQRWGQRRGLDHVTKHCCRVHHGVALQQRCNSLRTEAVPTATDTVSAPKVRASPATRLLPESLQGYQRPSPRRGSQPGVIHAVRRNAERVVCTLGGGGVGHEDLLPQQLGKQVALQAEVCATFRHRAQLPKQTTKQTTPHVGARPVAAATFHCNLKYAPHR